MPISSRHCTHDSPQPHIETTPISQDFQYIYGLDQHILVALNGAPDLASPSYAEIEALGLTHVIKIRHDVDDEACKAGDVCSRRDDQTGVEILTLVVSRPQSVVGRGQMALAPRQLAAARDFLELALPFQQQRRSSTQYPSPIHHSIKGKEGTARVLIVAQGDISPWEYMRTQEDKMRTKVVYNRANTLQTPSALGDQIRGDVYACEQSLSQLALSDSHMKMDGSQGSQATSNVQRESQRNELEEGHQREYNSYVLACPRPAPKYLQHRPAPLSTSPSTSSVPCKGDNEIQNEDHSERCVALPGWVNHVYVEFWMTWLRQVDVDVIRAGIIGDGRDPELVRVLSKCGVEECP
ncbi:hypothetical protein CVT24_013221 [Panaeolus cyanescens]|uniref:Uncharacterized protein n=1 Tax=Panaeolus cyanescens TaxID=181874 RepID=A0A409YMY6_9AGAR|nr:hypothetical protein CVT24_013221 [Panaeolus cyanescens]